MRHFVLAPTYFWWSHKFPRVEWREHWQEIQFSIAYMFPDVSACSRQRPCKWIRILIDMICYLLTCWPIVFLVTSEVSSIVPAFPKHRKDRQLISPSFFVDLDQHGGADFKIIIRPVQWAQVGGLPKHIKTSMTYMTSWHCHFGPSFWNKTSVNICQMYGVEPYSPKCLLNLFLNVNLAGMSAEKRFPWIFHRAGFRFCHICHCSSRCFLGLTPSNELLGSHVEVAGGSFATANGKGYIEVKLVGSVVGRRRNRASQSPSLSRILNLFNLRGCPTSWILDVQSWCLMFNSNTSGPVVSHGIANPSCQ